MWFDPAGGCIRWIRWWVVCFWLWLYRQPDCPLINLKLYRKLSTCLTCWKFVASLMGLHIKGVWLCPCLVSHKLQALQNLMCVLAFLVMLSVLSTKNPQLALRHGGISAKTSPDLQFITMSNILSFGKNVNTPEQKLERRCYHDPRYHCLNTVPVVLCMLVPSLPCWNYCLVRHR